jgi:hypothetical protein
MTKAELITALEAKYTSVATEDKWSDVTNMIGAFAPLGWQVKAIPVVYDNEIDTKAENMVQVVTDGTNYYWRGGEPKATPFYVRLTDYIASKIADNTIQYGVIKDYNLPTSKATVTVYMPDNSVKILLVTEGAIGNFTYKVIG